MEQLGNFACSLQKESASPSDYSDIFIVCRRARIDPSSCSFLLFFFCPLGQGERGMIGMRVDSLEDRSMG